VEGETTYTVEEAAAILKEAPERVREMLATGELDGIPPGATLSGEWKVLLAATRGEDQTLAAEEGIEGLPEHEDEDPAADEDTDEFVEPPRSGTDAKVEPTATERLSPGDNAAADREATAPSGWVSTQQAARALGISPRTVRWHIERGNLQAKSEGEGVKRAWYVSIDSLQTFRDVRQSAGEGPRGYHAPAGNADIAAESPSEAVRVLAERLEDAAARAAEYRVRLELSERAQSTLEADLAEERRRREAAEWERDELRRRLEASREASSEPRGSPVSSAPTETPAGAGGGLQEARQATQSAAETLRGPEPRPTMPSPQVSPQGSPQAGRRGRLWRRVFGR
jgi:Helix-turn-helix domain